MLPKLPTSCQKLVFVFTLNCGPRDCAWAVPDTRHSSRELTLSSLSLKGSRYSDEGAFFHLSVDELLLHLQVPVWPEEMPSKRTFAGRETFEVLKSSSKRKRG